MDNILSYIKDCCYGCGVCAVACGKNIISIQENEEGFYMPRITDMSKCVECKLCIDSCAFIHVGLVEELTVKESFAAWSNNDNVRRKCSSGGIGFELGKHLLMQNYKVCGVKYNAEQNRAEHYIASTPQQLISSIGSKYIQSYTKDGFRAINRKEKYLVTGTPCQIDSLRRYIRRLNINENNFVFMDFFCHSIPSLHVWHKYLQMVEKQVGKVTYVSWRNKFAGWHDSWIMSIEGKRGFYTSKLSDGDLFFKLFLKDFCINKACRKYCKYKYSASSADIRIGDCWGKTYASNVEGVSALVVFTTKGQTVISNLEGVSLIKYPFSVIAEGQMRVNAKRAYLDFLVKRILKTRIVLKSNMWNVIFLLEIIFHVPERVFNKLKKHYYK